MSSPLPLTLAERLNNGEYDATTHMLDEGLAELTTTACQIHEILKRDLNEEDRAYWFDAQKQNQSKIHNINNLRRINQPPSPEETKRLIELMDGLMNESSEDSPKADVPLVPARSTRSTDYMTTDGVNFVAVSKTKTTKKDTDSVKETVSVKETDTVKETDSVKNADDTESDNDTSSSYIPSSTENSSGDSTGSSCESSGESTQDSQDSSSSSLSN